MTSNSSLNWIEGDLPMKEPCVGERDSSIGEIRSFTVDMLSLGLL